MVKNILKIKMLNWKIVNTKESNTRTTEKQQQRCETYQKYLTKSTTLIII